MIEYASPVQEEDAGKRGSECGGLASRSAVNFAAKPAAPFKPPLSRHRQAEFHTDYD